MSWILGKGEISTRKIPKISPSVYKPPGILYLEIVLKYNSKTKHKR